MLEPSVHRIGRVNLRNPIVTRVLAADNGSDGATGVLLAELELFSESAVVVTIGGRLDIRALLRNV